MTNRADAGAGYLRPRWIFLRALGAIFFSAFYSLAFQIHGLIGERGILPAGQYLTDVAAAAGAARFWYVPSLFWLGAGDRALTIVVALGLVSSIAIVLNIWPRLSLVVATLLFLSCVTTLQDFSSYQSDGMLLEAGAIAVCFAPRGLRPGLGGGDPPSRISLFMLRWEWFRIYFESGLVKLMSGDVHWRNFTAMDDYYQNGPLPAWPGWYVQHFPHWYHAFTVGVTLGIELFVVWAVFLPRRLRLWCAFGTTLLQIGIIATANYAFLNYLVLMLGVLLVDDRVLQRVALRGRKGAYVIPSERQRVEGPPYAEESSSAGTGVPRLARFARSLGMTGGGKGSLGMTRGAVAETFFLAWIFYATLWAFLAPGSRSFFAAPERALEPFRIANAYGLFATMTVARYEIEFQGTSDGGRTWTVYPFRYKPQDVMERPGVYAPYQPRFEWNLWFASLGPWQGSPWVVAAQERLVEGSPSVLRLFRRDPFGGHPPAAVRTVLWQYWFTDWATKRRTGAWWRRQELGVFSGIVQRDSTGKIEFIGAR
ncbi:MAG TPA: lipase maturation factor family protein [Gemmatimonadaceae bacterium]|nr:lipase maturation factor family protein [Gemmatimonadaceae bacterium]